MIFRVLLLTFLTILWIGSLLGTLIIPIMPDYMQNETVNNLLGSVLCDPDEKLERVEDVNPMLGDIGIAMIPYCVNNKSEPRRDVTERWLVIGVGLTVGTFILSTIAEITFAIGLIRKKAKQTGQLVSAFAGRSSASLSDQLSQLEEARKAGLITYDEFDQKRGDILKKL